MHTDTPSAGETMPLDDERRMLLRMRDTLYEGSWTDFVHDLDARATDRPHVFATVPASDEMRATIARHLDLISEMSEWERRNHRRLDADAPASRTY
jgi:hypothetical protein